MSATIMEDRYLEVTYREGRPLAAYLYLPRRMDDRSVRTERKEGGLLIDYAADGRPIGIEITAPSQLTLESLNAALASIHCAHATPAELQPLAA